MRSSNRSNHLHAWIRYRSVKALLLLSALLVIVPESVTDSQAAFTLNWQRDYSSEGASFNNNDAYVVCNMSYISSANCSSGGFGGDFNESGAHDDNSAFLQEQLSLGGQTYYHIIVGDYTKDAMAQEMFIKASGSSYNGLTMSTSLVDTSSNSNAEFDMTAPYSTNSSKNGNGSGNPNNVMLRQVINETGTTQEFLKDSFTNKPLMSETISDAEMTAVFSVDMRAHTYSDNTPIGVSDMVNTVTLTGSAAFNDQGDAGTSSQLDQYHITAGAFTYTTGSGNGGSGGTYTYVEPFPNWL